MPEISIDDQIACVRRELLRTHAHELRVSHSRIVGGVEDWHGEEEAKADHDEMNAVANALARYGPRLSVKQADLDVARTRIADLERERDALTDTLRRKGFVPCDIAACNCGSWHHRYGLPQRMEEIREALTEAGHPLCNENGHLALKALVALVVECDALRADAERYRRARRWHPRLQASYWTGQWWEPLYGDALDARIDSLDEVPQPTPHSPQDAARTAQEGLE